MKLKNKTQQTLLNHESGQLSPYSDRLQGWAAGV
jgi:hypothetical protein